MKCLIAFILAFAFISSLSLVQESDTVYLKDGSVIKGEIIETNYTTDLRIETIKVRITGGSILVFTGDQILRIQNVQTKDVKTDLIPTPKLQLKEIKRITSYKNPGLACILSLFIFPGVGQIYNEQLDKGVGFFIFGLSSLVMYREGSKEVVTEDYYRDEETTEPKSEDAVLMGSIIFLGSWIFSGLDAYISAKSINESLALSVTPNKISLCYSF